MKRLLIIFSLMIASIFPTLFYFSNNMGVMMYERIYWKLFLYSVAPLIIFPIVRFFVKKDINSAFIILLSILSYHFVTILNFSWYSTIFVWLSLSILLTTTVIKWKNDSIKQLSINFFCILAPILLIFNAIPILSFFADPNKMDERDTFVTTKNIDNNIYYIVLDAYDREDVVKDLGYNGKLVSFLEDKGFYVAKESNSNYPWTFMSMPSIMNMRYINSRLAGKNNSDYQYIAKNMINNSVISRTLKGLGYKYIYNWEEPMIENKDADYLFTFDGYRNFGVSDNVRHAMNILDQFKIFDDILKIEGKKFVFADICCPHPTYVFKSDGTIYDNEISNDVYSKEGYIEQLKFIENKTIELIKNIQTNDPYAIIILQSDHGSCTSITDKTWNNTTDYNLKERMSTLNSFYFPDGDYSLLENNITSVNTFRLLLTKYFGYAGGLLDNEIYWVSNSIPASFIDITERVRKEVK